MTCAMVLYFDQPFEEIDAILGLTASAEIRMRSAEPKEDIYVLISRGFENISEAARGRLSELKYHVVDASDALNAVRNDYPFANEPRVWRGEAFHEMCFLRWLVLEKYFGNTPVLAMDADVVWRVDPHHLVEQWKSGGSTLCYSAPCFVFIKNGNWYEAYKSGLRRCAEDPSFGSEFSRDHFTGIYHDQALIQYLLSKGELENDNVNLLGHGFSDEYLMAVNPLLLAPPRGGAPLTFERVGNSDLISGKIVPYWHMQQRFSRYLWTVKFLSDFIGMDNVRVPYGRHTKYEPETAGLVLNNLHQFIRRGDVTLNHKRHRHLKALTTREGIYREFFDGDLADHTFRENVWWKPGVWATSRN